MKPKTCSLFSPATGIALALVYSGAAYGVDLSWDPDPAPGIQQGNGIWDLVDSLWTSDGGATNEAWIDDTTNKAIFNGPAGASIVSVPGTRTSGGLTFDSSGYTLESDSTAVRTLNVAGNIDLAAGTDNTIGSNMLVTRGNNIRIGAGPGASINSGTLNIASSSTVRSTGGSLVMDGNGTEVNVSGFMGLTGGTGSLNLGNNNTGITDVTLNIKSGGQVRIDVSSATGSQNNLQVGFANSAVASQGDVTGTINVDSGGLLKIGANGDKQIRLGQFGTGNLNVDGTVEAGTLAMGNGGNGTGILNLNTGGILATSTVDMNKAASIANFDGGTLRASSVNAGGLLQDSFGTVNVRDGGIIIDSNGFEVTVPRALLHSSISSDAAIDGGLTKAGAGKVTLTGANDYTGPTTILAGTIELGDGGTILPGDISNDGVLAFNKSTNEFFDDIVSGTGGLTHSGAGRLTLTNSNTFTGPTTVTTGILEVDNGDAISNDSRLVIDGSGLVELTQSETVKSLFFGFAPQSAGTYGATGSGATNIDNARFAGIGILTVLSVEPPDVLFWDTSTTAGFQKTGGNWNLSAANWSPEGTALFAWNPAIAANFGGDDTSATVTVSEDLGAAQLNFLNSNYTLVGDATPRAVTLGNGNIRPSTSTDTILGNNLKVTTVGNMNISMGNGIPSGGISILSGGTVETSGGNLGIGGVNTSVTVAGTLQITGGSGRFNLGSNQISGTDVSLTVENGGQVITAANLMQVGYAASSIADPALVTGSITVESGGLLQLGSTGGEELRLGQFGTGNLEVQIGGLVRTAKLLLGNGGNAVGILDLSGTLESANLVVNKGNSQANFDGGTLKVTADGVIIEDGSGTANILNGGVTVNTNGFDSTASEDLLGVGSGGLTKTGTGTLLLTGANTYTGATNVSEGCLTIGEINAIPDVSAVNVAAGAGFGGIVGPSNLSDSDIQNLVDNVNWAVSGSFLVIDTNGADITVAANITGDIGLIKKGAGILTLTGTNTYTGATIVEGGSIAGGEITDLTIAKSGSIVTLSFTASENVDIYRSTDLTNWSNIATDVGSPYNDNVGTAPKYFYVLVSTGETFP